MITTMRRGSKSPLFLGLLGLIAVAFVVTGINAPGTTGFGSGLGAASLASVGGEDITVAEVTDQAERRLAQVRQQQPEATIEQLVASGGVEEIISGLVSQKALRAFADEVGMRVSKALVDGQIASMPAFFDLAGKFSEDTYREKLAAQRVTDAQLRDDLYTSTLAKQLLTPVGAAARVPQGVALPYASMLLESRTGQVGIVPSEAGGNVPEPTDAELATFYGNNRARYVVPERRVIRYALIGPEQAGATPPTEAEIAAFYRANAATFAGKETRVLSQVVLPDEAAARALSAKVTGGQSFVAAAAAAGFGAGDISIGPQDQASFARLTAEQVASQVFRLAEGGVSPPLRSPLGWHVVKVDAIRREAGKSLDAARGEIATRLAAEQSAKALEDFVSAIDKQIGDGASFADVATQRKLTVVQTPPITAAGASPEQPNFRPAPELTPLLANAFIAEPGEDPSVDAIPGANRYAMVAVDRIVPASPPPLTAIRVRVLADLKVKRAADRARALAAAIVAKVNAGMPIARAFAEAGIRSGAPRAITARRIDVARANQQIPPPIQMLFSLPQGRARLLAAPGDAGYFVVFLERVARGDAATSPGLIEATRTEFSKIAGQEYVEQFVGAIRGSRKVVRDQAAITRLKSQLNGTATPTR
ncbi:MAG TPA: SurA N-terminal domain-containing protein [Sphingomonadaceae bacterium]|nr:SurA N-terminal domain-containing protein [Sphingomonadaceae bacterium]